MTDRHAAAASGARGKAAALVLTLTVGLAGVIAPAAAQPAASPRPPAFLIDDDPLAGEAIATALRAAAAAPAVAGVRLRLRTAGDDRALAAVDRRLAAYPANTPVWLAIAGPGDASTAEAWRAMLRRLLAGRAARLAAIEIDAERGSDELARFALRVAAAEGRAANERLQVVLGLSGAGEAARLPQVYTAAAAPYADGLVIGAGDDAAGAAQWLARVDPAAALLVDGRTLPARPDEAARSCARSVLWTLGTEVSASIWSGPARSLSSCLAALAGAAPLVTGQIVALDAAAAGLAVTAGGAAADDGVRVRLLFDQERSSTWLAYDAPAAATPLAIDVRLAADGRPVLIDLEAGGRRAIAGRRDAATGVTHLETARTGHVMLLDFDEGASGFVDRAGVTAARHLSVEEIVARHQQQQSAQDAAVDNYMASARTEQHFRPTITDPGYDVVTENVYYVDREGIEWEERAFYVNGSRWGADRPPFPMLQPEKVLSLPLALRLGDDYRYRLAGEATVDGIACYELAFEPVRTDRSLYKGTVWIDRQTFATVRVKAVQTNLAAPVISNEETQTYRTVAEVDGRPIVLLTELVAHQVVLIAGRSLVLDKHATFEGFQVNAADFAARREAARASDRIMFRETDRGLRYYTKENGQRVVSDRGTSHVKAMAMGVLVDPSYRFPLPLGGINYLNFEVQGRSDTQFALLFAGVLAAGNLQRPHIGKTPLDASVDFFAIATPAWDRLFDGGRSRDAESLLTWPLSTSVNLGWQATPFVRLSTQYQFRFDGFARDSTTDESFVVPSSTTTHGIGGSLEYRRGGYSLVANATRYQRSSWKPWGPAGALTDSPAGYTKYSLVMSRDFHLDAFQKLHVDASWFGGRDLDRFSRYQFGMFDDTRIHGVPASGIRFDELRMTRGSYSFNIFDQYRLDLFLEQAWGREQPSGPDWRPLTGTGVAVNVRAPWNTILRVDFGHAFLPSRYQGLGATTLQVMVLKPLH